MQFLLQYRTANASRTRSAVTIGLRGGQGATLDRQATTACALLIAGADGGMILLRAVVFLGSRSAR